MRGPIAAKGDFYARELATLEPGFPSFQTKQYCKNGSPIIRLAY